MSLSSPNINRQVTSLCPTCFKTIPAIVYLDNGAVLMRKSCSQHGDFDSLIEPDAHFYATVTSLARRESRYNQVILDVTSRCNLSCPQCYYPVSRHADPTLEDLCDTAGSLNLSLILGGAEPTMRKDLPLVVQTLSQIRPVSIITNGIALADDDLVLDLAEAGLLRTNLGFNTFEAAISLHTRGYNNPKAYDAKLQAIDNIRSLKAAVSELMFTITHLNDLAEVLVAIRQHARHTRGFRIRGPHNTWNERGVKEPIFVSELFNYLATLAHAEGVPFAIDTKAADNNLYHLNVRYDGIPIRLISCPEKGGVILGELMGYGPFYHAQNGELTNFIHALLINQGIQDGWIHGRRIEQLTPATPTAK